MALLISSLGFFRVVYFVSLGYGFSIAAMALLSLGWFGLRLDVLGFLHLCRDPRSPAAAGDTSSRVSGSRYRREKADAAARSRPQGSRKVAIWLMVSFLYVAMFSPGPMRRRRWGRPGGLAATPVRGDPAVRRPAALRRWPIDQKAAFKAKTRRASVMWASIASFVAPTTSAIVVWVGSWVAARRPDTSGSGSCRSWGSSSASPLVMGSTRRLERSQKTRPTGRDATLPGTTFAACRCCFLVPVYSLKNVQGVPGVGAGWRRVRAATALCALGATGAPGDKLPLRNARPWPSVLLPLLPVRRAVPAVPASVSLLVKQGRRHVPQVREGGDGSRG